ncbi:hypothetical protein FVF58_35465 [Paraburkholderia panacisoli]|uniref:Uncharacterized protein n=1 Tax=Paraburkholderia panacisoli TaxID=2603818 RepID=A0A5B0GJZ1_9BURK|nr:hypothetical protein [Paraburkholderia panacisoli]KAA1003757.1 hypothetical protein FVF58_35465 [Paraburkholderia panacisoli]
MKMLSAAFRFIRLVQERSAVLHVNTPSVAVSESGPAPQALLDVLLACKVVVVAGAGVSVLQPSNLLERPVHPN